jgi:DNA invertase Pin-like site-specific DNA recombinase
MNAYAYIRVSGQEQADKDGPVRQLAAIKSFADANGIHVAGEFKDVITGEADAGARDGWCSAVASMERLRAEAAKLGSPLGDNLRIDFIIAEAMHRLGRTMVVTEQLLMDCKNRGIKVLVPAFGMSDVASMEDDPNRVFMRQVLSSVAQFEKNVANERMNSAKRRIRASGQRCDGRKPFGSKGGEIAVLEAIFHYRDIRKMSYGEIAKALNRRGIPTRMGQPWTRGNVIWHIGHLGKGIQIPKPEPEPLPPAEPEGEIIPYVE